jgi:hypothetical protein
MVESDMLLNDGIACALPSFLPTMDDPEKGSPVKETGRSFVLSGLPVIVDVVTDDAAHEAAAAKLWAVYVSEAERYDRALVESWMSDMQGILIFVGGKQSTARNLTTHNVHRLVSFPPA